MSAFATVQARSCSSKTACAPSAALQLRAGERQPHALLQPGPSTHWLSCGTTTHSAMPVAYKNTTAHWCLAALPQVGGSGRRAGKLVACGCRQ